MKLQASAVKQFALAHAIPVAQPRSLRLDGKYPEDTAEAALAIAAADADLMVVAAYGLILPQWVLVAPKLGCLNIHGSLLPRWRGAAPIHRAIEAGDVNTGVTIMQMDAGLDTGDMLLASSLAIAPDDTTSSLHDKVAALGADLIVKAVEFATTGRLQPVRQPAQGVTYAHKIEKQEAAIDWTQDGAGIVRRVRAFNPFPGASTTWQGETIKVWSAEVACVDGAPLPPPPGVLAGTIVALAQASIAVTAMNSIVNLTELQRPGGKRLPAAEFLRGAELAPGMRLGLVATADKRV
jgi:methionyl-tRNA formyltransferase